MTTEQIIKTANEFEAKVIASMTDAVYAQYKKLTREQRSTLVFGAMKASGAM